MPFLKSVLYVFFCGVLSHFIGEALPRKWFRYDRFPFAVWKWERGGRIYDRICIREWKDRMPDMSRVMKDMMPKRLPLFPTAAQVRALIRETCVAEAIHVALCVAAQGITIFWDGPIGAFLALITILGNLPFIIIQRYNRPMLVSLAERLEEREERRQHACADSIG